MLYLHTSKAVEIEAFTNKNLRFFVIFRRKISLFFKRYKNHQEIGMIYSTGRKSELNCHVLLSTLGLKKVASKLHQRYIYISLMWHFILASRLTGDICSESISFPLRKYCHSIFILSWCLLRYIYICVCVYVCVCVWIKQNQNNLHNDRNVAQPEFKHADRINMSKTRVAHVINNNNNMDILSDKQAKSCTRKLGHS